MALERNGLLAPRGAASKADGMTRLAPSIVAEGGGCAHVLPIPRANVRRARLPRAGASALA